MITPRPGQCQMSWRWLSASRLLPMAMLPRLPSNEYMCKQYSHYALAYKN